MRIDYRNPNYTEIFRQRQLRLDEVRSNPTLLAAMKVHYPENPWDFINDWGMTFDPRLIEEGKNPSLPFILWDRQEEFLHWLMDRWKSSEYGLAEKSRDCGVTWLCVGFCCVQWLFRPGYSAGFGSAVADKVDKMGDPDCIFEKIRFFIKNVPDVFMPVGFQERLHSGYMKLVNPENEATIIGGSGNQIGRGGRKAKWIVDESAFVENQQKVASAISFSTNCHIDVSTFNGNGNLFYRKSTKFEGTRHKFIFDWRQDPRKDEAWYKKQVEEKDPVTVAQEIDRDPNASVGDIFIPAKWVEAAVDLHKLIKVEPTGIRSTGFDPADTGDARSCASRHGYVLTEAEIKVDGDIVQAIPWAYQHAFNHRSQALAYDADGMGAPVMKFNMDALAAKVMDIIPYYGSGEVVDKKKKYGAKDDKDDSLLKTNEDTFQNYRGQTAIWLRDRFENAYKVRKQIEGGGVVTNISTDELISIDSNCKNLFELKAELSRPLRVFGANGKIMVESKKDMKKRGIESPNLFDATVMAFSVRIAKQSQVTRHRSRNRRVRDKGVGM